MSVFDGTSLEMFKLVFLAFLLSADAQKLKLDLVQREGVDISSLLNAEEPNEVFTYRLPNNTWPKQYLISLDFGDFDDGDLSFTGTVGITIDILSTTDVITLHSSVLVLSSTLQIGVDLIDHDLNFDVQREFLFVNMTTPLAEGTQVRLTLNYRGSIGASISGVYRGSYLQNRNERRCSLIDVECNSLKVFLPRRYRFFLASHMQPTFFRRVSPGYDEPHFKSYFSLVLRHNQRFESISNAPVLFSQIE